MKVLSLFSGAGGLDLGLEAAGFDTIACVEFDRDCIATLQKNRPDWSLIDPGDVTLVAQELTPQRLDLKQGELDAIVGGPPCQPFSNAAQWTPSGRRGITDKRADTVSAMLTLVEAFLPRVILVENVVGFIQGRDSAAPHIDRLLSDINFRNDTNYRMAWQVANAADYGIAQERRRAIGVAFRDSIAYTAPPQTHASHRVRAWDAIGDLPRPTPEQYPGLGRWKDLLPSIPEGGNYQWFTSRGGGEEIFGYRTRYWTFLLKLAKERPSWTISASPGPSTGPFHWENRHLTVHERLRIQSFPDDWHLVGDLRSQIRMAGNATPPLLAEVFGRAIRKALEPKVALAHDLHLVQRIVDVVPGECDIAPFPASMMHLIGPKTAHGGTGLGPSPRSAGSSMNRSSSVNIPADESERIYG